MFFWHADYKLPNGVTVTYWKHINSLFENGVGIVKAYGYVSQAEYEAGSDKAIEQDYVIDVTALDPQGTMRGAVVSLARASQTARIASELAQPDGEIV